MKYVLAFVRPSMAEHVVDALTREGCADFSLSEARRIVPGLPHDAYSYSVQLGQGYEPMVRVELVCRAENADRFVEAIRRAAHTGAPGDGMVFIGEMQEAVRIRNGDRGDDALS